MGTVMALVTIPRIICGPLAGAVVDQYDRRRLIILGDAVRGISILLVAFLALRGVLEIWMIMAAAVVSGICASFFNPAIESVLPDIVPEGQLLRADSAYQMATTGADMLGQSLGGILYGLVGAPFLFLADGISYLFSAATEVFIDVPERERKREEITLAEDLKEGIRFLWKYKAVVRTIVISFFINFFFGMIRVLIIPWFTHSAHLGEQRYGILNAVISAGMIAGMAVLSVVNVQAKQKYRLYLMSLFLFIACIGAGALVNCYPFILFSFFAAFVFQFIFNAVFHTALMQKIPAEQRGKVLAVKTTLGMAVSPPGNFIGGVLGEFIAPRVLIAASAAAAMIIAAAVLLHSDVKTFLNDAAPHTVDTRSERNDD